MRITKKDITIILILVLLETIGVALCYVWFDKVQLLKQCILTFINLFWLGLLYFYIRKKLSRKGDT